MKHAISEDYFRGQTTVKKLAMLLILFSLVAGLTFTERADAEDNQKDSPTEAAGQTPAAGETKPAPPGEDEGKTPAAKVNGVVITNGSVIKQMKVLAAKTEDKTETKGLREKALDGLIFQELAYQKAKAEGLTVDQKTIDEAIEKIKTSSGGEHGFSAFLEGEKLTEEGLREILVRSYALRLLLAREVTEKITVTEDELKQEYEKEKEKYRKPEKLTVIDVIFFLKSDDADSVKKAEELLKKINEDEEKDPLKLVSDGTFIAREMEVKKEDEPVLYEEAKKLKEGGLSGVIMAAGSYHIIKLKEYIPERQKPLDEVRRNIDVKLIAEARKKRLKEFEAELKKEAKIEIIEQ